MLKFVYDDKRYKSAANPTQKTRAALFVILDFIASKLLESMSWLFTATVAYLLMVVFYSNMVLFANISMRLKGLIQIAYSLGFILAAAIFILFALLIIAYLAVSLMALVRPSAKSSGAPSKTMEKIRNAKAFGYVRNIWDNMSGFFSWKAEEGHRNLYLLLILSLIAFYHTWLTIPANRLRSLQYDVLPDFFMQTARELFKATWPYVSLAMKYISSLWDITYKFATTMLDKII